MSGNSQLTDCRCAECGRMFVAIAEPRAYPLCATCITAPGWFSNPELTRYFAEGLLDAPPRKPKRKRELPDPGLIAIVAAALWMGAVAITLINLF